MHLLWKCKVLHFFVQSIKRGSTSFDVTHVVTSQNGVMSPNRLSVVPTDHPANHMTYTLSNGNILVPVSLKQQSGILYTRDLHSEKLLKDSMTQKQTATSNAEMSHSAVSFSEENLQTTHGIPQKYTRVNMLAEPTQDLGPEDFKYLLSQDVIALESDDLPPGKEEKEILFPSGTVYMSKKGETPFTLQTESELREFVAHMQAIFLLFGLQPLEYLPSTTSEDLSTMSQPQVHPQLTSSNTVQPTPVFESHLVGSHRVGNHLEGSHVSGSHLAGSDIVGSHIGSHPEGSHLERYLVGRHLGRDLEESHVSGSNPVGNHVVESHLVGNYLGSHVGSHVGSHLASSDSGTSDTEDATGNDVIKESRNGHARREEPILASADETDTQGVSESGNADWLTQLANHTATTEHCTSNDVLEATSAATKTTILPSATIPPTPETTENCTANTLPAATRTSTMSSSPVATMETKTNKMVVVYSSSFLCKLQKTHSCNGSYG